MPDSKEISQLTTAEQITANDLLETAIPNAMTQSGYISRSHTLGTIATFFMSTVQFTSSLLTTAKTIIGAINELHQKSSYTELTGSLTVGSTTVVFTDNSIVDGITVQPFVDEAFTGVVPTAQATDGTNHTLTLTFPAQESAMPVKVRIS